MTAPAYFYEPQTRRQRLDHLRAQLDQDRQSFLPHWRDLADYILPRRGRFQITDANRGERRSQKIIDSTATFSARTLGSGMHSGVTSPARPWLRLTVADPDLAESGAVKEWLHTVTTRMLAVFARSNWYQVLPTFYKELGVFGTAAMIVMKHPRDTIRCYSAPIGSYYLGQDADGRINTFIRVFRMTVRQLLERFGGDKRRPDMSRFSQFVKTAVEKKQLETWVDVVHVIEPNEDYDGVRMESRFKRYYECYYETTANNSTERDLFLSERGYDDFPVLCARWETVGEDVWATDCPGMTALGDIKQLQLGERRGMQAYEKLVNPPMKGPPELRTAKASILPGDITYVSERENMRGFTPVHEVRPEIQQWEGKQEQVRYRIKRAFYEDLFLMLAQAPGMEKTNRTATEIVERKEEKLVAIGPVLEQVHEGVLSPGVDLAFAAMLERGEIPPPPEELEGQIVKPEFISILAQAQKMIGMASLERFVGIAQAIATIRPDDPSLLDKINFDEVFDEAGDSLGIPPRLIRPDEEVAEMRAAAQEQAQAAQRAAQLREVAAGAKDLAAADTSGQNALTDLLAGAGTGTPELATTGLVS